MILLFAKDPSSTFNPSNSLPLRICTQTPIAPLALSSLALRRPFRELIVLQGLCALVTLPWIWSLAAACKADLSIAEAVNEVCTLQSYIRSLYGADFEFVTAMATSHDLQCSPDWGFEFQLLLRQKYYHLDAYFCTCIDQCNWWMLPCFARLATILNNSCFLGSQLIKNPLAIIIPGGM